MRGLINRGNEDGLVNGKLFWGLVCCPFLILLVVILSIFDSTPLFEFKKIYIPALEKSFNSSKNTNIDFNISLINMESRSKVYYDPINVTFYDGPNQKHPIANFTIPEFCIRERSTVDYSGMVDATGFDFDGAKQEISANRFKVFRVGQETSVRYDFLVIWKTTRYEYKRSVDVKVGDTEATAKFGNNFVGIKVLVMFNLMVVVFLCSY